MLACSSSRCSCLPLLLLVRFVFASIDTTSRFSRNSDPFLGKVVATRAQMNADVEEVLTSKYRSDSAERLTALANEMRSTYMALPKTEQGYLGDPGTRYLLHRHFLRTRSWLVHGIAPDGGPWNASRPTALLRYSTPTVTELFEQRLSGRGLDLQEVALLAAMIENQIHQDEVRRLHKGWNALGMRNDTTIPLRDGERVLDTYMMSYFFDDKLEVLSPKHVDKALAKMPLVYPNWNVTQTFMRATLQGLISEKQASVRFDDVEHAVVDISENYGKFSFSDCKNLKSELLALEGQIPGRVTLSDFYYALVYDSKYQFSESIAYLRHTGILDETDPANPSVVIPNYVLSPSQLLAVSDTFAKTCMNECEQVMIQIEEQVQAPYVTPARVAAVVASISTETQPERPEGLPRSLLLRLAQIARKNSEDDRTNLVSLHGRLFAQWLHHAFPRECPYPPSSHDKVELLSPFEYNKLKNDKRAAAVTQQDKYMYANLSLRLRNSNELPSKRPIRELPWDPTEELLAPRIRAPRFSQSMLAMIRAVVCIAFVIMLFPNLSLIQGVSASSLDILKPRQTKHS